MNFTREADETAVIYSAMKSPVARQLLYLSRVHLHLYREGTGALNTALDELNSLDFRRSQVDHHSDGIFAEDRYTAQMETARVRVLAMMVQVSTAGQRYVRSVMRAIKREKAAAGPEERKQVKDDWAPIRNEIRDLEAPLTEVRDVLEHLYDQLNTSGAADPNDYTFSRDGVLKYLDARGGAGHFDFSEGALDRLIVLDDQLMKFLRTVADREPSR